MCAFWFLPSRTGARCVQRKSTNWDNLYDRFRAARMAVMRLVEPTADVVKFSNMIDPFGEPWETALQREPSYTSNFQ